MEISNIGIILNWNKEESPNRRVLELAKIEYAALLKAESENSTPNKQSFQSLCCPNSLCKNTDVKPMGEGKYYCSKCGCKWEE